MMDYKLNLSEEDYAIAAGNGINRSLAYQRYYCGWTAEESITKPKGNSGKLKKLQAKAKANGLDIKLATIYDRIKRGWTEEEAISIRTGGTKTGDHTWIDIAASNGIGRSTYHGRRRRGWTKEDAVSKPVQTEFNWRELG